MTSASAIALVALMPAAALAQDAAADPAPADPVAADNGEEIVVSGYRYSLENSINLKRDNASMVEAISAEDIGKLPDTSIAESIARLPGLAAQRTAGRASIVSIRGFSPDFSTVLLNGRQQASSGYNRAVEFDQYPSELLGSVVVYKSPDASVAGMGLAGTVDLRTLRPLEHGKQTIAMNVRGQLDEDGGRNADFSKWGGRGSIAYIDQNDDGTLGWALGYAYLNAAGHIDETKNWFYDNVGGPTYLLSGQEAMATNSRDERHGLMGTLEWEPSDSAHMVLDLYYSQFKQNSVRRGAEWFSYMWADNGTHSDVEPATIDGNQFGVAGHFENAVPIVFANAHKRKDRLFAAGWNGEFQLDDATQFTADLSYSTNKRDERDVEAYLGYGAGPFQTRTFDGYDFEIPVNDHPQFTGWRLDYADAAHVSLGDRAPWGGWGHDGLDKSPHVKEDLFGVDFGLKRDLGGFLDALEVGVNYASRTKAKTVDELDLNLKNGRAQVLLDPQYLLDPTSLGFAGSLNVLAYDIWSSIDPYYDTVQLRDAAHYDKAWQIDEDILTGRAKLTIESGNLHGNVGVQVIQQWQKSTGLRIDTAVSPITVAPMTKRAEYTDILPSLNLSYELGGGHTLRFAAAKVMQRPRMDDMRANMTPSFNGSICAGNPPCSPGQVVHPWSASGGNPDLRPWRAKEIDLAYEWYGGGATYFSVNAFDIFLDNYIYTQVIAADFSGFPLPDSAASIPDNVVISPIGELTAPANGDGGWVRGVEVSGALDFGKLTSALAGFGVTGSLSYSDYHLEPTAESTVGVLPGFSKWVYNLTGYYERGGFQARASYRYRSAFEGEVVSLWSNLGTPMILADKQLDAQIGYTFPDTSSLAGLGVTLQVSNVLNSPYRTSYDVNGTQMLETYEEYGRQWLLGVSYKL